MGKPGPFKKWGGRIAAGTMGFILGNVPGAVAGYEMMKRYEKTYPESDNMITSRNRRYSGFGVDYNGRSRMSYGYASLYNRGGRSTAWNRGKFKKPRKLVRKRKRTKSVVKKVKKRKMGRKRKQSLSACFTKAQRLGYHITGEIHGVVQDPHCAYVSHSTLNMPELGKAIMGAMVRKVFKKAGIEPVTHSMNLQGAGTAATYPAQYELVYEIVNPITAGIVAYSHVFPTAPAITYTFDDIIADFNTMRGHILDFLYKDVETEPLRLHLFQIDAGSEGAQAYKNLAILQLTDETLHVCAISTLAIQNRSAGENATGSGTNVDPNSLYNLDRVDNQPVKGLLYEFKHASPMLRVPAVTYPLTAGALEVNTQLQNMQDFGVRLVRSAELKQDYWEPPNPKAFANLKAAHKVSLQPGDIKRCSVAHQWKGTFTSLFKKLGPRTNVIGYYHGGPGYSQTVCLEEVIRTSGGNPITLNYEREHKVGVYLTTNKKKSLWVTKFETATVNNVP